MLARSFFFLALLALSSAQDPYTTISNLLIDQAMMHSNIENLEYFTDTFGPRLAGSTNLELAIDWILSTMESQGILF